jgi:hypothetical protein
MTWWPGELQVCQFSAMVGIGFPMFYRVFDSGKWITLFCVQPCLKIQNFSDGCWHMNLNYKAVCVNTAKLLKYNWNLLNL